MLAFGTTTPLAVAGSVTVTSASSPTDTPAGGRSKATCARRSSVTLSLTASMRATVPASGWPGFERSAIAAGRPVARPRDRPWSKRTLTHSESGSISFTTACPATTVDPGSASRLVTTASAGASKRTLSRCCRRPARSAASRLPSCSAAARLASAALDPGIGRSPLLQFGFDPAGTDEVLLAQVDVAAGIHGGQFPLGTGVLALRIGRRNRAGGPRNRRVQRSQAFVDIDRIHLGEQLPRLDPITDVDHDAQDPAGRRGADQIGPPGLDRADAEEGRNDGAGFGTVQRDPGPRQGAGARAHERHGAEQQHGKRAEREPSGEQSIDLHRTSLTPRR